MNNIYRNLNKASTIAYMQNDNSSKLQK